MVAPGSAAGRGGVACPRSRGRIRGVDSAAVVVGMAAVVVGMAEAAGTDGNREP
jgi:hypothetical protein